MDVISTVLLDLVLEPLLSLLLQMLGIFSLLPLKLLNLHICGGTQVLRYEAMPMKFDGHRKLDDDDSSWMSVMI